MDTTTHVRVIADDLRAAAGDHDDATVDRLVRGVEASLHLRLLDVLGEAALELSEQLPDGHVDVRLAGRDARFVLVADAAAQRGAAPTDDETSEPGGVARLTLRMPERLKRRVEEAAAGEGISTNSWLVEAVSRNLDRRRRPRAANRITGYARG